MFYYMRVTGATETPTVKLYQGLKLLAGQLVAVADVSRNLLLLINLFYNLTLE